MSGERNSNITTKSWTNRKYWYKFDQNRTKNNRIIIFEEFNMANISVAILNNK